jgi:hypothetical protein
VWQELAALKIEMWVKLSALGQRRNLVEGDSNFAFFIHPDGVLWGTYLGKAGGSELLNWVGANSDTTYSPDGVRRTVPLNTWTKLTYLHDGIATIRLFINDQLVGINSTLRTGIRPTGPLGVHIGHWPGDDRYTFAGDIDEVKIWKYDPDIPQREFYCRPLEAAQVECWGKLQDELARLMQDREQGEQVRAFMLCLWDAQNDFIRALRSKGQAVIEEMDKLSKAYMTLWCAGDLGGAAMMQFVKQWMAWAEEVAPGALSKYQAVIERCIISFKMQKIMETLGAEIAKCDPMFAAMVQGIAKLQDGSEPTQPIQVTSASPTQMTVGTGGTLTLTGANFTASTRVELQMVGALNTTFVSPAELKATVPASIAQGQYAIRINDGSNVTNTGFTLSVTAATQPPKSFLEVLIAALLELLRRLFGGRK